MVRDRTVDLNVPGSHWTNYNTGDYYWLGKKDTSEHLQINVKKKKCFTKEEIYSIVY